MLPWRCWQGIYIVRLQAVQNSSARFVSGTRKFDHISPVLVHLHWLPVQSRIEFKIITLTHKCLYGTAPQYLSSVLRRVDRARALRSNNLGLLVVPRTRTVRFGDRSFAHAAPVLWNALRSELRTTRSYFQFRRLLKTHLFTNSVHR